MVNWVLNMGTNGGGQQGGSPYGMLIMLVLMFAVIYFLLIRPQQKRQKQQQKMLSELKRGDRVITSGGMVGTIHGFNEREHTIVVKFGEETKIEFLKSSIVARTEKTE